MKTLTPRLGPVVCAVAFSVYLHNVLAQEAMIIVQPVTPARSAYDANQAAFTMRPSVITSTLSTYGTGEQRLDMTLSCVLADTRQVVPNCDMTLDWSAVTDTGGHIHDGNRPPGRFLTANGKSGGSIEPGVPDAAVSDNSGAAGLLDTTYIAPEASGTTRVTGRGTAVVDGRVINFGPLTFDIDVEIDGLALAGGAGLNVLPQSRNHGNNNGFASAETDAELQALAKNFAGVLTAQGVPADQVPTLTISAISLPHGGLFDYDNGDWKPPHISHRFGNDADLFFPETFTDRQRRALGVAIALGSFDTPVPSESPAAPGTDHWHLRL